MPQGKPPVSEGLSVTSPPRANGTARTEHVARKKHRQVPGEEDEEGEGEVPQQPTDHAPPVAEAINERCANHDADDESGVGARTKGGLPGCRDDKVAGRLLDAVGALEGRRSV